MSKAQKERKGEGHGEEAAQPVGLTETEPPNVNPKSPTKMVVFRSVDKGLALYQKAGYTDRSHGIASYTPSAGIQFVDYYFRIEDKPENKTAIEWLRKHPAIGIKFQEVPDVEAMELLPGIDELEKLPIAELHELAKSRKIMLPPDAGKADVILALLKGNK